MVTTWMHLPGPLVVCLPTGPSQLLACFNAEFTFTAQPPQALLRCQQVSTSMLHSFRFMPKHHSSICILVRQHRHTHKRLWQCTSYFGPSVVFTLCWQEREGCACNHPQCKLLVCVQSGMCILLPRKPISRLHAYVESGQPAILPGSSLE